MDDSSKTDVVSTAKDKTDIKAMHEANRVSWNEGARYYTSRVDETIEFLRKGNSNIHPIEKVNLGDLRRFKTAIHLQCASGRDTLSLLNEGVNKVVGIDISDVHIENAKKTVAALGWSVRAEFYRCDVLDAPHELDWTADLVYTGRGALCWIHDIEGWAKVIARLLKPGGIFHIFDDHPFTWLLNDDTMEFVFSGLNYFSHVETSKGWSSNYIGDIDLLKEQLSPKFERTWPLSSIFQAIRNAGLVVEKLCEHNERYYPNFQNLKLETRQLLPMTFSLLAVKP